MLLRNFLLLQFLLLLCSFSLSAQLININGIVTDEKGYPLPGVTVMEKNTTNGTITDYNGHYSFQVKKNSQLLVFSFVGMQTEEILIDSQTVIDVVMKPQAIDIDEIVVVGYGVQKRTDVTGSVVSIKPDDLSKMPQTSIVQSLQGKIAGVSVFNTGSSAEGSTRMRVRAQNSINADASPFIVLDGVPYSGFLSEINPSDIERVEILKDASSAAIYGSRAANGVMLITTKKGTSDKGVAVSFEARLGADKMAYLPEMMSGSQFYELKRDRVGVSYFEVEQYDKSINTHWLDEATRIGARQEYNLSLSGGNQYSNYYISGNFTDINGIAKQDHFNRFVLRTNYEINIRKWLKLGTNTQMGYYERNGDKADFSNALRMSPLTDPYDEKGNVNFQPWPDDLSVVNPLEPLNYLKEDVTRSVLSTNFIQIDFPFINGLTYKLMTGYNYRFRLIEQYRSSANTLEGMQKGGVASVNNQGKEDWTIENILDYSREFRKHKVGLTAVYSAEQFTQKYHDNQGVGFPSDHMSYYQFRLATTVTPSDSYIRTSSLSQMLRLNYSFNSRYLLTMTARRDGFSAFGENSKYGIFPSAAIGWNVSEESFMKNVSWIDRLKLRLSYGENGNQAISAYSSLPSMSLQYYLDNDKNTLVGFFPNKLADPSLSWETTQQINAGVDFNLLKGRLNGSIDLYRAYTYDLLLNKVVPQINGVNNIRQNIGKTQSSGIEFQFSSLNIKTNYFDWKTDVSFSKHRNEILDVGLFDESGKPMDNLGNRWFIGQPINVVYSYVFDGIWQEGENIVESHMPEAKPGDIKIKDISGPDGIPDGKITTDDRTIIGIQDPDFTVGLMNSLNYKNWNLSFFLYAVKGPTRYTEYLNTYFDGRTNIRNRTWWTAEHPINTYPANRDDSNPYGMHYYGKPNDASYIRLSDVTIGYNLPGKLSKFLNLNNFNVYLNCKNLFTLTNYVGLDPEFTSDYDVPQMRTLIVGLKISF